MEETPAQRIRVGVADAAATADDRSLVTSGLGSCVAIAMHDGNGVGGLIHAMLPEAPADVEQPPKYVDAGVDAMLEDLQSLGAHPNDITAKVVGGASMLDLGNGMPVGEKNVVASKAVLDERGISVAATETGGDAGRSVTFEPASGVVTIKRVDSEEDTI
jgi:chemotaxis protein CheD